MKNSNIDTLKELGNEYFKDSFFNKPVKPVIHYGRNDLQIGKTFDGRVFTIDIREAMRILFVGLTGAGKTWVFRTIGDRLLKIDQAVAYLVDIKNEFFCVDSNQKIITNNGIKRICDVDSKNDLVLSFNFKNNYVEYQTFQKSIEKYDDVYEVEFEDGSKIKCTENHKFFTNDGEKKLSELRVGSNVFRT